MQSLRFLLLILAFCVPGFASAAEEMRPWIWQQSTCENCAIAIQANDQQELHTEKAQAFLRALESQKSRLIQIYGIHGQEYNLLAQMAIGILGRESRFFQSPRYYVKEAIPEVVSLIKVVKIYLAGSSRQPSPNSRGPTQIKNIPLKISEAYHFSKDELYVPEHAAVATMGFLIESLQELKRRVALNNLDFVTPETYVDYLPYLYFGSVRTLVNRRANPSKNIYIRDMKIYMSWVQIFESAQPAPIKLN
jgi:hypothetical protein